MEGINVREVMHNNEETIFTPGVIKTPKPSQRDAWDRLTHLRTTLNELEKMVNEYSDISNTELSWKIAYEKMFSAFHECMSEEKIIIVRE